MKSNMHADEDDENDEDLVCAWITSLRNNRSTPHSQQLELILSLLLLELYSLSLLLVFVQHLIPPRAHRHARRQHALVLDSI